MPYLKVILDEETHRRFKVACANHGLTMQAGALGLILCKLNETIPSRPVESDAFRAAANSLGAMAVHPPPPPTDYGKCRGEE